MKADATQLLEFLNKSRQLVVPIYQRTYSWEKAECRQLWDDIMRAGKDEAISAHFIGPIVYIQHEHHTVTAPSPLLVIDGQQRITTASLIIEAIARRLGTDEPVDGFSARKLRNRYLRDAEEVGERSYKLLLTQTDRQTLLAIVSSKNLPDGHSLRLKENFEFFQQQVQELGSNLEPLCTGLNKLMIVDISLKSSHDNPQLIFESMNSTGRELGQADLIRNFILMGLEPRLQEQLYNEHWRPMEIAFGQKAYSTHFDSFMRHYLTVKTGEIPRVGDIYKEFKIHANRQMPADMSALVADVHAFAGYYCAMALGKEPDPDLATAFADLRELTVDVAYPFLLELYRDYSEGLLPRTDFLKAVRLVESYVFRRKICAIPTNSQNKTFAGFGKALNKDRYLESILAHFSLLQTYRRFPPDKEFGDMIKVCDLYGIRNRSYWLRRLENHGRKEQVSVNEYTTEHIMPQKLTEEWQSMLGDDWQTVHNKFLHTLGNLTLTGYNSEYSNHLFTEKRDMEGGFKNSPLNLNEDLGKLETWNEAEIRNRANQLAQKAIAVWEAPDLPDARLDFYRPDVEPAQIQLPYTINDYKYLAEGSPARALLDNLRKEVRAFDPGVTEEFFKTVIAYKAETNFVDVIPQAKRLKLILNLSFHELQDPKCLARDVTNIGSLGNGDVEVHLSDKADLSYIMGLVRQAFEKQMGNENVGA
ncbi:MAG: DUF262 and DUF1524 domain-containing protein [Gammaproteobacteria bacterium]|nr:DUF262 and DUF1524 domain-containing protein [Gammaproteobacteria bacterium]